MIRIVGIQRSESPNSEFVLLQNQGGLRINLRGHIVVADTAIQRSDLGHAAHVFADDTHVPPGAFVLLTTGVGESRSTKTKDGNLVFYCFMSRPASVWEGVPAPLHVLALQHTYTERREFAEMR